MKQETKELLLVNAITMGIALVVAGLLAAYKIWG